MKRILSILLVLAVLPVFGQQAGSSNWGTQILLGTQFTKTDSSRLKSTSIRDTVLADTLYSGLLEISDYSEGIWSIKAWLDNVGGTTDSVRLDVRMATAFRHPTTGSVSIKFSPWYHLLSPMIADSLYRKAIAASDSIWWQPDNQRQFRIYDLSVSTDTSLIKLTDHLR